MKVGKYYFHDTKIKSGVTGLNVRQSSSFMVVVACGILQGSCFCFSPTMELSENYRKLGPMSSSVLQPWLLGKGDDLWEVKTGLKTRPLSQFSALPALPCSLLYYRKERTDSSQSWGDGQRGLDAFLAVSSRLKDKTLSRVSVGRAWESRDLEHGRFSASNLS